MPKCKYCGRSYSFVSYEDRHRRNANNCCQECSEKLDRLGSMGGAAVDIGRHIIGGVASFLEERKRNLAAPSIKPRIRKDNSNGYDDLLDLTDTQWRILSDRQFNTICERLDLECACDGPKILVAKFAKFYGLRHRDAASVRAAAKMFEDGGDGMKPDFAEALALHEQAATMGDANEALKAAAMYEEGKGCRKNLKKAFELYQRAAIKGSGVGCCRLGQAYAEGLGCKKDAKKSFNWYLKAAEKGVELGQHCVGLCYYFGDGVEVDKKSALVWFLKSAEQHNPESINNIGVMLHKGEGIPRDDKQSRVYLRAAAAMGDDTAKKHLLEYFGEKFVPPKKKE